MDTIYIHDLRCQCIIGDESWERETVQEIHLDLELGYSTERAGRSDSLHDTVDYGHVATTVTTHITESRFHLIEALAESIAQICLAQFPMQTITVHVRKPSHVQNTTSFGIRITRTRP